LGEYERYTYVGRKLVGNTMRYFSSQVKLNPLSLEVLIGTIALTNDAGVYFYSIFFPFALIIVFVISGYIVSVVKNIGGRFAEKYDTGVKFLEGKKRPLFLMSLLIAPVLSFLL